MGQQKSRYGNNARRRDTARKRRAEQRARNGASTRGGTVAKRARRASQWPLWEALITHSWRSDMGGAVLVSRRHPKGGIAIAGFMVDLGCLGAKNAFFKTRMSLDDYEYLKKQQGEDFLVPCDPSLAVKVVFAAVEYARSLGFAPHKDYLNARPMLSGIDSNMCDESIECGKNGKPFFMAGPYDNVQNILTQLRQNLGSNGFHYLATTDDVYIRPPLSPMPKPQSLEAKLLRCGEIKHALVEFTKASDEWLDYANYHDCCDTESLDQYLHDWEQLESFVDAYPELSAWDIDQVLGWEERVFGIFTVEERCSTSLVLRNVIDARTYRAYSNLGRKGISGLPKDVILNGHLVPFEEDWLFSGPLYTVPRQLDKKMRKLIDELDLPQKCEQWLEPASVR
jgi:hypothetical protein